MHDAGSWPTLFRLPRQGEQCLIQILKCGAMVATFFIKDSRRILPFYFLYITLYYGAVKCFYPLSRLLSHLWIEDEPGLYFSATPFSRQRPANPQEILGFLFALALRNVRPADSQDGPVQRMYPEDLIF